LAPQNVSSFAEVNWETLISMAEALVKLWELDFKEFRDAYRTLTDCPLRVL